MLSIVSAPVAAQSCASTASPSSCPSAGLPAVSAGPSASSGAAGVPLTSGAAAERLRGTPVAASSAFNPATVAPLSAGSAQDRGASAAPRSRRLRVDPALERDAAIRASSSAHGSRLDRKPPPTDRGALLTKDRQNTSSEHISFHIDYLSATIRGVDASNLSLVISQVINILCLGSVEGLTRRDYDTWREVVSLEPRGGRGYAQRWTLPLGVTVYSMPRNTEYGNHAHLEIKGEAATAAGGAAIRALFGFLDGYFPGAWAATRVDLAWDGVPFTPVTVRDAVMAGDVRTRARREGLQWHESPLDPDGGRTCSLGSRQSDFFLRVYDKRGPTRCELQVNGGRAAAVVRQLVDLPVGVWAGISLGHLRDFIDFIDSSADTNSTRAPLVGWWKDFINGFGRAGLVLERVVVQPLAKARAWVFRKVSATVAMILHADLAERGGDLEVLVEFLEAGKALWSERHRATLASAGVPL